MFVLVFEIIVTRNNRTRERKRDRERQLTVEILKIVREELYGSGVVRKY